MLSLTLPVPSLHARQVYTALVLAGEPSQAKGAVLELYKCFP